MKYLSFLADILSVISAIITIISALAIKKYYKKIVRQYSVERLTLSEQHIHSSIDIIQEIKRIYSGNPRGRTTNRISNLYLDIDEILNNINFALPSSFDKILESIAIAKEKIKFATNDKVILTRNSYFDELDDLLNIISLDIKQAKETIQYENMK